MNVQHITDNKASGMTDDEIEAAALSDPDNLPLTPDELATARPVPKVRALRFKLNLSQAEFATRFHLAVGTVRDWEQGRTKPDQTASAYLDVIANAPDAVMQALGTQPEPSMQP